MKKKTAFIGLVTGLCVLSSIPAFASGWQKDTVGWWYGTNENNTTWYNSGWQWVDGNNDGIAESYYFNSNGYIAVNTIVDGYTVNNDGAWTVKGSVQTKQVSLTDTKTSTSQKDNSSTPTSTNIGSDGNKPQTKGSYYDGMSVDSSDHKQTLCDYDDDGKLTGIEYEDYKAMRAMDGVKQEYNKNDGVHIS